MNNDYLRGLKIIQIHLKDGALCTSYSTCLVPHLLDSTFEQIKHLSFIGEDHQCTICEIFEELKGTDEQRSVVPAGHNFCPCMVFGREDAMIRLAKTIERLENENSDH